MTPVQNPVLAKCLHEYMNVPEHKRASYPLDQQLRKLPESALIPIRMEGETEWKQLKVMVGSPLYHKLVELGAIKK